MSESAPSHAQPTHCAYPWQQMIIDLTGEVVPCCFWSGYGNSGKPLGNTNENTLDEIWNGPAYQALREENASGLKPGHPCHECVAYKWANGQYPDFEWPVSIRHEAGHAYIVRLPERYAEQLKQDSERVVVLENGEALAHRDSLHDEIRQLGAGRYSLWGGYLYLSSSDNSDPRTNGREYTLQLDDLVVRLFSFVPDSHSGENLLKAKQDYEAGVTTMAAKPTMISLISTADCNIDCPGCSQNMVRVTRVQHRKETVPDVLAHVPYLYQFIWHGGEPYLIKRFREFIDNFVTSDNPNLTFGFTSNGTMLTARELEKLKKFPRINASVSIDSFQRASFEKIRRGADFDRVIQHVHNALQFYDAPDRVISVGMIICKSNFLELADNLAYAIEHDIGLNLSPVVIYPVAEQLNIFTDFAAQTRGWQETLNKARSLVDAARTERRKAIQRIDPGGMLDELQEILDHARAKYSNCVRLEVDIQDPHESLSRMRNPTLIIKDTNNAWHAYVQLVKGPGTYTIEVPRNIEGPEWELLTDMLELGSALQRNKFRMNMLPLTRSLVVTVLPFTGAVRPRNIEYASYGETTPEGLIVSNPRDIHNAYQHLFAQERAVKDELATRQTEKS